MPKPAPRPLPRRARSVAIIAAAALVGGAAVAVAQQAKPPHRVLHEELPSPHAQTGGAAGRAQPYVGPEPGVGQNPSAIARSGKLLPEPELDRGRADQEPVLGEGGFAADRQTSMAPDNQTGADGTLHYASVFNPDVIPFKRMTALDAVQADYTLVLSSPAQTDVDVGGSEQPGRDLFWGSVMIALTPGREVPLPSVAPDMRILSYETDPPVRLTFSRDPADNFYVRSDEVDARGTYRLVFMVDGDSGYFAAERPAANLRIEDVAARAPVRLPDLPAPVRLSARVALRRLGVDGRTSLADGLDRLIGYFRAFEAKALPPATGDIYLDLFQSQAGVCRHRSFAFMITASAVGIPTRYVSNEAHAWIEVWLPDQGWVRVDLGGAAMRMEVSGADDKTMHRPRSADPFEKPPAYENGYTQLEGDIRGLSQSQLDEAHSGPDDGSNGGAGGNGGTGNGAGGNNPSVGPGRKLPQLPASVAAGKTAVSLTVEVDDTVSYRGESFSVRGRVTATAGGVAGQRVDVYLAPAGGDGDDATMVGHTLSDADGGFTADVDIPSELGLGRYEVYVATPGDSTHAPSVSQ